MVLIEAFTITTVDENDFDAADTIEDANFISAETTYEVDATDYNNAIKADSVSG